MTEGDALRAIAAAVEAGWSESLVIFPAQTSTPPDSDPYVIVAWRGLANGGSTHGRPGERQVHRRALVIAQVYEPTDPDSDGDSALPALDRAARFRALFDGLNLPDTPGAEAVTFIDAVTTPIGQYGAHYQVNVTLTCTYPATF